MPGWGDTKTMALIGKLLVWDVTVVNTEHPGRLYVATAARGCGELAELAAARKCQKYADIHSA